MKELLAGIKNKQRSTAKTFNILMVISAIFTIAPFIEVHPLSDAWALTFTGIILTITFFIVTRMFDNRAKKMDSLKSGEKLLVHLELTDKMQKYFHHWDYPLSGLTSIKEIKKPFRGIHLSYFYTGRTLRHVHEIKFPIPDDFDPGMVIAQMQSANKRKPKK